MAEFKPLETKPAHIEMKRVREKEYEVPDRYSDSVCVVLFSVNPEE